MGCESQTVAAVPLPAEPTALMVAASKNDVEGIQRAREDIGVGDAVNGTTALMLAASRGHLASVRELLREAQLSNKRGETALMFAAERGFVDIVRELVQYEGKISDTDGKTALMRSVTSPCGSPELWEALVSEAKIEDDQGHTALQLAAMAEKGAAVRFLVKHEGNMINPQGECALLFAARQGWAQGCELLLCEASLGRQRKQPISAEASGAACKNLILQAEK